MTARVSFMACTEKRAFGRSTVRPFSGSRRDGSGLSSSPLPSSGHTLNALGSRTTELPNGRPPNPFFFPRTVGTLELSNALSSLSPQNTPALTLDRRQLRGGIRQGNAARLEHMPTRGDGEAIRAFARPAEWSRLADEARGWSGRSGRRGSASAPGNSSSSRGAAGSPRARAMASILLARRRRVSYSRWAARAWSCGKSVKARSISP